MDTTRFRHPALAAGLAVLLIAAAVAPVAAHHSFAAFNMQDEKTVTGTVRRVDWTNPHIWIWLDVPNNQGGMDVYAFEGMSPNFLERRGWKRTTLKTGDTVTITYRPMVDGSKGGMFTNGRMENGTVLTMGGAS
jgi:hypothetical protein